MTAAELQSSLVQFAAFARALKGDEKSEAQLFLDHFFRALGHGGVQEAGATLEFRIAKKPGSAQLELLKGEGAKAKGGKKFADLLWPERVLIEMKSRGQNLEKHYDQCFDYWTHIVPRRPPYVILCNFDEFWIYDFNTQLFDPVERVSLRDIAQSVSAFNFLLPIPAKPIFDNNRVEVTRTAYVEEGLSDALKCLLQSPMTCRRKSRKSGLGGLIQSKVLASSLLKVCSATSRPASNGSSAWAKRS